MSDLKENQCNITTTPSPNPSSTGSPGDHSEYFSADLPPTPNFPMRPRSDPEMDFVSEASATGPEVSSTEAGTSSDNRKPI